MSMQENTITIPSTRLQCRHILPAGLRCRSACLRNEPFCYFHHNTRKPIPPAELAERKGRRSSFHLPLPEDRASIGHAIGLILQRIAANTLDPRRAGLLLYGLQTAAIALPKEPATPVPLQSDESEPDSDAVSDLIDDPTHGTLAPELCMPATHRRKSLEELLFSDYRPNSNPQEAEPESSTPINLQAAASPEIMPPLPGTKPRHIQVRRSKDNPPLVSPSLLLFPKETRVCSELRGKGKAKGRKTATAEVVAVR